ncbi:hypothetical protein ACO0SA_001792 [Hanseniaspora valbyensis]
MVIDSSELVQTDDISSVAASTTETTGAATVTDYTTTTAAAQGQVVVVVSENIFVSNGVSSIDYYTYTTTEGVSETSTLPTTTLESSSSSSSSSTSIAATSVETTSTTAAATTTTSESSSSSSAASTTTSSTSSSTSTLGTFEQSMLDQHNTKRALHEDTSSLVWSSDLESVAQAYADSYDCSGTLTHSGAAYGENLALGYPLYEGTTAIDAWYNEIEYYDFSDPGYSEDTGHFTQVVWKDTYEVGCGYKNCNNAWGYYLVCNYLKQGNVIGEFASEVEPLK